MRNSPSNMTTHAPTLAAGFLRPGGKLVALCADGPRQRAELQPMAIHWEKLPAGTFSDQGTAVNVALLVIQN